VEAGPSDNPMGRKQILLRLNQENRFLAAVELDDEMVIASALDLSPRIIGSVRESTNLNAGVDGLVGQLLSITRQVVEQAGVRYHICRTQGGHWYTERPPATSPRPSEHSRPARSAVCSASPPMAALLPTW